MQRKLTFPLYPKAAREALVGWEQSLATGTLSVSGRKENKAKVLKSHPEAGAQTREGNNLMCWNAGSGEV